MGSAPAANQPSPSGGDRRRRRRGGGGGGVGGGPSEAGGPRDPSGDDRRVPPQSRGGGGGGGSRRGGGADRDDRRRDRPSGGGDDDGDDDRAGRLARDLERKLREAAASSARSVAGASAPPRASPSRAGDKSDKLDRFIGRDRGRRRDRRGDGRSDGPSSRVDVAGSVACSALTTPSALLDDDEGNDEGGSTSAAAETDEDASREPLLPRGKDRNGERGGRKRGERRVGFRGEGGDGSGKSEHRNRREPLGFSAPSLRRGAGKWFASSASTGSHEKYNNGGYHRRGNGNSGDNGLSKNGVPYRTASSTRRALEDLRRRRVEARERRRALAAVGALLACAAVARLASSGFGSGFGSIGNGSGGAKPEGLRGSRDKEYGDTKDVQYGGERVATAAGVPAAAGDAAAATGANDGGEGEDGELPPPKEKTYDKEHEFLLPLRHFADLSDVRRPTDVAFFFHVPRAGGSTIKSIVGRCLDLVQSSEVGVRDGRGSDPKLEVVEVSESRYVNVDTTTVPGIQRAVDLGLARSGLADVVVSSYLHESAALFDLHHRGRASVLLRDPVHRAASMYWHRVKELGDLDPATTVEDYAQGNGIENNWMCRFLADRMTGELTKDDLEHAKAVLKDKFLVGFLDDLDESVHRMMKYHGWKYADDETDRMKQEDCVRDLATSDEGGGGGGPNANPHEYEIPKRGSQAHALISWQTQFDAKLYAYAREIFDRQTKEWGTKERKKAMKKERKKKGG
ncbi:hypothetical protein ACHAWF_006016 [Thalassiosira exigua]